MRFYRNKIPIEGEIVYVKTKSRDGDIFYVDILEYDIEGKISLSNMTNKTSNKQYATIGSEYPAVVLSNDGGIYLSRTKVKKDDIDQYVQKYEIARKITVIGEAMTNFYKKFNKNTEEKINIADDDMYDYVMEKCIWKYYENLEDDLLSDKDYKYICNNINTMVKDNYAPLFESQFLSFINTHIIKSNMEIGCNIDIICYAEDAIKTINYLFQFSESIKNETNDFKLKVIVKSPPHYQISLCGDNEQQLQNLLKKCCDDIMSKIDKDTTKITINDTYEVIKEPTIILKSLSVYEIDKWFEII